jgi:hypothetical protein
MLVQVGKPAEKGVRMREEYVIRDLIDRAIWDEHFRYKARRFPESTLTEAGFWNDLTTQEKEGIELFRTFIYDLTDVQLVEELKQRSLGTKAEEWGP